MDPVFTSIPSLLNLSSAKVVILLSNLKNKHENKNVLVRNYVLNDKTTQPAHVRIHHQIKSISKCVLIDANNGRQSMSANNDKVKEFDAHMLKI
jgi:hypothetical protein